MSSRITLLLILKSASKIYNSLKCLVQTLYVTGIEAICSINYLNNIQVDMHILHSEDCWYIKKEHALDSSAIL